MKEIINYLIFKLEEIVSSIPSIIIRISNRIKKEEKYKLEKENILNSSIQVIKTPEILLKNKDVKLPDTKGIITEVVKEFLNVIINLKSNENLKILFNNLNTLKIDNKFSFSNFRYNLTKILRDNPYTLACYISEYNIIFLNSPFELKIYEKMLNSHSKSPSYEEYIKNCLFHELFHMTSSYYDEENEREYSGFSQFDVKTDKEIGRTLTEGYTECLCERYFYKDNKSKNGYSYYINISKTLEFIIGRDLMMKFYFQADLLGLLNELSKYVSMEETKEFILNLDKMFNISNHNNKQLEYLNNKINLYLIKLKINKMKLEYPKEVIKNSMILFNQILFINTKDNLPNKVTYPNYDIDSLLNDEVNIYRK